MTATAPHTHRVSRAVTGMRATLDDLVESPLWSMPGSEAADTLTEVTRLQAQLAELHSRLLVRVEQAGVAADAGATSTPNWFAHQTKTTRTLAHRQWRLAQALERHQQTRVALAEGRLQADQAEAILRGLADLPHDADPDLIARAEAHLIDQARDFDAKALKHLARHVLEVACPDTADAHQAQLLEKEEREAAKSTQLVIWDDGHGTVHGRFTLDTLTGAALKQALLALAAPKHRATQGPLRERRPTPERLGQAFTEMIQRYPTKRLPKAGGLRPHGSTPARPSARHWPARWRARQASSPPSSTATATSSTSAARSGSTPKPSGLWPSSSSATATPTAATTRQVSASYTTRSPGTSAARPTATACCSAHATTPEPTTPTSPRPSSPAAESPSTDGREPTPRSALHTPPAQPFTTDQVACPSCRGPDAPPVSGTGAFGSRKGSVRKPS
jgi:hypothetical protein